MLDKLRCDYLINEKKNMVSIDEVNAQVVELNSVVAAIDLKLDNVRAFVAALHQLAAALDSVKASAESVLAESDSTDGTP